MAEGHLRRTSMAQSTRSKKLSRKSSIAIDITPQQQARQIIQNAKFQLDSMILTMDEKIKKRIQVNQSTFLHAYKDHMDKVNKQLKILKEQNDLNQTKFSADNEIICLGKQCALFRQQAIRLQNQLEDTWDDMNVYRRKVDLLESELLRTDESLKKMMQMKRNIEKEKLSLLEIIREKEKIIAELSIGRKEKENENQYTDLKIQLRQRYNKSASSKKQESKSVIHLNIPSTNRTSNLKTNQTEESFKAYTPKLSNKLTNYQVFYPNNILAQKVQKITKETINSGRARLKTYSNLEYRKNRSYQELNASEMMKIEEHSKKQKIQKMIIEDQVRDEFICFQNFMYFLNIARNAVSFQNFNIELESKSIRQLISNDKDIFELCTKIFPHLELSNNKNVLGHKLKFKSQEKQKSIAHLSSQLMKKLRLKQTQSYEKQPQSQNKKYLVILNCPAIDLINEDKKPTSKLILQSKQMKPSETHGSKNFKKMNESFQKKNLMKSSLNEFYSSIKYKRLKTSLK